MTITLNGTTGITTPDLTGSAPLYVARAWVNFNGIGTVAIRGSGNVSSITDIGVGNYRVNFTNAIIDSNYCVQATGTDVTEAGVESAADMTTTTVLIRTHNSGGTTVDREVVSVTIFR